jgi:hypothetical protein
MRQFRDEYMYLCVRLFMQQEFRAKGCPTQDVPSPSLALFVLALVAVADADSHDARDAHLTHGIEEKIR